MLFIPNFDLLIVGIVVAATALLGFTVYFNDRENITNKTFLFFSLVTMAWGLVNFLGYQMHDPATILWLFRSVLFFAVYQAFFLFQLFYVFPSERKEFPVWYGVILRPIVLLTSLLTLTPFVFSGITTVPELSDVPRATIEPGIIIFGLLAVGLVSWGIGILISKLRRVSGEQRDQLLFILLGAVIMFAMIIVFNFVLPAFFDVRSFIPLGALFIFPFIVLASYAIVRYRLLNIQIVGTELFIFIMLAISLAQVVQTESPVGIILNSLVFLGLVIFGVILIKGVIREIKQREELEDVTAQLQDANEELKKLDEQKSDFITIASHQLRTPLTIIKGYISLIVEKSFGALPSYLDEPLKRISLSNDRLINLVNDLLDLSRIERGKMTYVFEKAPVLAVVEDVFKELQEAAKQKKLEFTLTKPAAAPESNIDPKKIKEVLINIVDNAIHYTAQGFVRMAAEYDAAKKVLRVSVQDSGIGLTPDEIQHLFVKFSRMDNAKRVSSEGTGLGLYVAKLIVEDHKGKIWVESKGHNAGSTFIFEIPTLE